MGCFAEQVKSLPPCKILKRKQALRDASEVTAADLVIVAREVSVMEMERRTKLV